MKITRGKKHTFLGMNIQMTIEIDTEDQLLEAIEFLENNLKGK